mmetsp:Transcript_32119/g.80421  ORF Transcript_32119/g.80421 Transcript_32119/m.80421 type:complete len:325 (-) Transcript_32119:246-1220(-)
MPVLPGTVSAGAARSQGLRRGAACEEDGGCVGSGGVSTMSVRIPGGVLPCSSMRSTSWYDADCGGSIGALPLTSTGGRTWLSPVAGSAVGCGSRCRDSSDLISCISPRSSPAPPPAGSSRWRAAVRVARVACSSVGVSCRAGCWPMADTVAVSAATLAASCPVCASSDATQASSAASLRSSDSRAAPCACASSWARSSLGAMARDSAWRSWYRYGSSSLRTPTATRAVSPAPSTTCDQRTGCGGGGDCTTAIGCGCGDWSDCDGCGVGAGAARAGDAGSAGGTRRKASAISAWLSPFLCRNARLEASLEPRTLGCDRKPTALVT